MAVKESLKSLGRQCIRQYCRSPFRGKSRLRGITDRWLAPDGHIEQVQVGPSVMLLDHRHEATRNMAYGTYEAKEIALLSRILHLGDVAADVGANVGYLSAHMAKLVGPSGKVYSFEPGPTPFRSLTMAKESNSHQNQEIFQMAVADEDRRSTYYETESILSKGYGRIDDEPSERFHGVQAHDITVTSLTSFFADRQIERLRLIKIDVEGHEKQVIQGLTGLLERGIRPILITEVTIVGRTAIDVADYEQVLLGYGYEAYSIVPTLNRLDLTDLKDGFHGNVAWMTEGNRLDAPKSSTVSL